jgi:hypothetical protein
VITGGPVDTWPPTWKELKISRTKRYAISALAASVALLGLTCAQPALAASGSPGAYSNPCYEIPISAEAGYLKLCFHGDTFTVENVPGSDDDDAYFVLLAATGNPDVTLKVGPSIAELPVADGLTEAVRTGVVDLEGMANKDIATLLGSPTADRVAVAPGQTLTVTSTQAWTATDVYFGYDRAAALSAVIGSSLAENIVLKHLPESVQRAHEMAECVEYIRHWVANGGGSKKTPNEVVADLWKSSWNKENGHSECQSFASYFDPDQHEGGGAGSNEDEDNNKSQWQKLWEAVKDTVKDVAPDIPDYFDNPGDAR